MGGYYDLFLSLELQPDLPEEILHEIRWHLRLTDEPPTEFRAFSAPDWYDETPYPFFNGTTGSHAFDGVDVTALLPATHRLYPDGRQRWLMTVRSCVHEDELGYAMDLVRWLASYATTTGWIGYLGYTADPAPKFMYYVDGTLKFREPAGPHRAS
ncbi:hypothetical protein GCM10027290_55280 [Micromonospora sonneratiae]|uniref:Uncharacterized protein n=1 Tax=Micromonospora sonneratiae TaxID=1184706 RepID=A0ABW3Y8P5_9ACTN